MSLVALVIGQDSIKKGENHRGICGHIHSPVLHSHLPTVTVLFRSISVCSNPLTITFGVYCSSVSVQDRLNCLLKVFGLGFWAPWVPYCVLLCFTAFLFLLKWILKMSKCMWFCIDLNYHDGFRPFLRVKILEKEWEKMDLVKYQVI